MQYLINSGANLHATDKDGFTPLHFAAGLGHAEVAQVLINSGANLSAEDKYGFTALDVAHENVEHVIEAAMQ